MDSADVGVGVGWYVGGGHVHECMLSLSASATCAAVQLKDAVPPPITKDSLFELEYLGEKQWQLFKDGEPVRVYDESELRITLVWRQHCFRSEEERARWEASEVDHMTLDGVLDKLVTLHLKDGLSFSNVPPAANHLPPKWAVIHAQSQLETTSLLHPYKFLTTVLANTGSLQDLYYRVPTGSLLQDSNRIITT